MFMTLEREEFLAVLQLQVETFFKNNNSEGLLEHSLKVAEIAESLAKKHGVCEVQAYQCGLLHDLGRTLKNEEYIPFCKAHSLEVLTEEMNHPSMLHQKVSKVIAKQRFGISDESVLEALTVHTTMCPEPSDLGMVLHLADKMSWGVEDNGDFIEAMQEGVKIDLRLGVQAYLNYQFKDIERMEAVHPLTAAAYEVFCKGQPIITLRPVDKDNWEACVDLKVAEEQKSFVAPNWYSMLQTTYQESFTSSVIYADGTLVGYMMYGYDPDTDNWELCRLMIDQAHQAKGYGRAAMGALMKQLRASRGSIEFYTSIEPDNLNALKLYESLGFVKTGEIMWGEEVLKTVL